MNKSNFLIQICLSCEFVILSMLFDDIQLCQDIHNIQIKNDMLMKFARKSIIFNSLSSPWLSKIATTRLFDCTSYNFCVKPDRDNQQAVIEPETLQAPGSTKIFKPRTQKQAQGSDKPPREKVFKQKSQKDRDSELSVIFRQYRQDVQREGVNTHRFAACCKLVSNQYRIDRHQEFLGQRDQLEKLLETMSRLDFRKASFQDLMNMLDLVRTAGRIESMSRRSLQAGRTALLQAVGDYCSALDTIATSQLIFLYCKLCPLPFAELNALTVHVHDRMVDMANEGGLPFSNYQFYVLFKSLSKKKFLSYPDKRILEMLLVGLQGRVNDMDSQMLTSMVKAFIDLRAQTAISDIRMLRVIESVFELGVKTVQSGINHKQSEYLLECRPNDNPHFKKIITIINSRLFHKIRNKTVKFNPLKTILACYRHLGQNTSEQRQLVVQIATELFQKQPGDRRQLQSTLIELLREGYFGSDIQSLNELVSREDFEFFWSIPCYYSIYGQQFPVERLLIKLKTVLKTFNQDANFLKAAVSASVQARLQPENAQLSQMVNEIKRLIGSAGWQEIGVDWLVRLGVYNPQVMRAFVLEFGSLFQNRVHPSPDDLRREFAINRGQRLSYLPFWEYLFSVGQFDRNCPQELVVRSPLSACTLVAIKETGKMNCPLDGKSLLLAGLLGKMWSGRLKCGEGEANITIELLRDYSQALRSGRDSFDELYWNLVRLLVRDYKEMKRNHLPSLHFLIMGLLTSGSRRTRNGIHFKNFFVQLLSNPAILSFDNQSNHFKGAILRTALQHNMLLEQHLSAVDINFFSAEEVALLKAVAGQYQCEKVDAQNVLPFLRSSLPAPQRLKQFSVFIDQFCGQMSLDQLQKCLLFFALERESVADSILLRLVGELRKKMIVKEVDVLGIIANIRGHLSVVDRNIFVDLLTEVTKQLETSMHDWALFDHLQLLKYLNMYAIAHDTYRTALIDYAFRYEFRGTALLEIMWQVCKGGETKLSVQQFAQLGNYSTFNPQAYLRLVLIHEQQLTQAGVLLEQMSRYQVKPVGDSLFAKYANSRFGLTLKRSQGEGGVLRAVSELGQTFIERLQREGVSVKREELGADRVFLLGERILLVFGQLGQSGETHLLQHILGYFYPGRELAVCGASGRELRDLLLQLRGVQLEEGIINQITQDLQLI